MMDGLAAVRNILQYAGLGQLLRLTGHGLLDLLQAPFGGAHFVPTVGRRQPPVMSSPDADAGYRALAPPGFRFEVAARIALSIARTARCATPTASAARCSCRCASTTASRRRGRRAGDRPAGSRGEAQRYPIGHFEPYFGAPFERSVGDSSRSCGVTCSPDGVTIP